jgi:hypothetical protein
VRRETGKEYEVKVFDDKDVANHIDLEPCGGAREGVSEASAEEGAGRPLSRESSQLPGADTVVQAEGNTGTRDIASAFLTRRGRRPRHAQTFLVREPGYLEVDRHAGCRSASERRNVASR